MTLRKTLALLLIVLIVFPLTLGALSVISVSSWVLDRNFYQDVLGDPRLYEVLLSEDLPTYVGRRAVAELDELPVDALSAALREVVTPQYLRDESVRIVNQVFDVLEGRRQAFDITLDIAPIKAALRGEASARFARALAAALPTCAPGQDALAADGALIRCLPSNVSVDEAAGPISLALPAFLDKIPDHIELARESFNAQRDVRAFSALMTGTDALNVAVVILVFIAGSFWLVAALLAGEDRRQRLQWLGWSLLVPALLIFLMGIGVSSGIANNWMRFGLNEARFGGLEYSAEFRQALLDVSRNALSTVANGFLATGAVSGAIALALIVWSNGTPRERYGMPVTAGSPMSGTAAQPVSPAPDVRADSEPPPGTSA